MTEEPAGTLTTFLEDGSVKICYHHHCGWVTSAHLIIPKALQLQQAYRREKQSCCSSLS